MRNFLKTMFLAALLAVISVQLGWGQHTMTSTTLSAAVTRAATTISVASATGVVVTDIAFVDDEAMRVTAISGTTLTVTRGVAGTGTTRHASGATIYIDEPRYFGTDPANTGAPVSGTPCTSTVELVLPRVDPRTGQIWNCTGSLWVPQAITDVALTSPTITTDIRSVSAGSATVGTDALPFGEIFHQGATVIQLEGATANASETVISVTDPTGDRAITIPDAGGTVMLSSLATNGADAANAVTGASNALVYEGTADAFELSLSASDVGADVVVTLPTMGNVDYAVLGSTLTTNNFDAANAIWAASNVLRFEGATANAFELSLSPADVGADVTATLPAGGGAAYALLGSTLTTNDVDVANSIWGVSNNLRFEGATADANETSITPADATAARTVTLADASGTVFLSSLATNAPDIANSVWGVSNGLTFEGATADAFEVSLAPADPTVGDTTLTIPNTASTAASLFLSSLTTNSLDIANSVWGVSNGLAFEGATADAFEVTLSPADPTVGDTTLTIPNTASVAASLMVSTLTTNTMDAANAVTGASNTILYEGSTADASETSVQVQDPSADRTVTFPNATGVVNVGITTEIILCGQQANNGTIYMSPISGFPEGNLYVTGVAGQIGGAICDAEDNAVEATADEPLWANNAVKILGMVCKASSSGVNGVTLNLRSAAASLTPDVTITIATGNTTGATTTATTTDIAAGATFGLRVINTEDLSLQDAWCIAKALIVP